MDLTALQHSPLLQSLGWAIANSLWQAAALWLAYYLINASYKNAPAKFKTNIATILLSSAFVWFCFTLFDKYFLLVNTTAESVIQVNLNSSYINTYSIMQLLLNKIAAALPYLSVAYLILLAFLSTRLITSYRYTKFIKSHGLQKPAVEWKLFAERVSRHIGINKKIKLWVSHHIDVPATIGFLKPVILIPVASINQLTVNQLEAIILHELSHIKRNDYLINIFISLIETILFFNPFIVLLAKIIKRERENCCDDFVIQYQYDRHSYASALLSLEQYRNTSMRLAISATSGKKQLLYRVKRIMEVRRYSSFNYGQKLLALLLITGVISSIAWLSPTAKETKKSPVTRKVDTDKPITKIYPTTKSSVKSFEFPETEITSIEATIVSAFKHKETKPAIPAKVKMSDKQIVNKLSRQNEEGIESELMSLLASIPQNLQPGEKLSKVIPAKQNDKIKTGWSFSLNINSADFTAAMQKFENAMKKIDFTTIAEYENMQKEINQALTKLGNTRNSKTFNKIKDKQLEELKNTAIARTRAGVLTSLPLTRAHVTDIPSRSLYIHDSVEFASPLFHENKVKRVQNKDKRTAITVEGRPRRTSAPQFPSAHFYYFNNKGKENVRSTPLIYRAVPAITRNSVKSFKPHIENYTEDKRGSITINGKTLRLTDPENIVPNSRENKIAIVSGDHIIEIRIDN